MATPEQMILSERLERNFYQYAPLNVLRENLEAAFNTARMSETLRDRIWNFAIMQGGDHEGIAGIYGGAVSLVLFALTERPTG